ncbi:MAG: hypothetical protein HQK83_07505 [Fibrobacteria bacterium]|nr:hypothetical protein [Fibrobacteria bacterium]
MYKNFIVVVFVVFTSLTVHAEPLKILALGNSITQGNNGHNTYRRPLYHKLINAGYNVDFVGSLNVPFSGSYPNPDFDLDHEGHWGWKIDEVLAKLPGWLNGYTPDVAIIHLGTNDAAQNQSVASSLNELSAVIDALRTDNPNIVIFLAKITPLNTNVESNFRISQLNSKIPTLKATKSTDQSPIIIVDQNTGFDPDYQTGDTYDKVHPNPQGEEKMAVKWFKAIDDYYKRGIKGELIRVLTLGNSITQGAKDHSTYRYPLYKKLIGADYLVDFLGSMDQNFDKEIPPDLDFDLDHEGHWGWRIDQILAELPGWLATYTPDAALIHLGTNDAAQKQSTASSVAELKGVIEALRSANPKVVVFLAKLIPFNLTDSEKISKLAELNVEIVNILNSVTTAESPVILVDQNEGFDKAADTYDNVHPGPTGEEKMAEKWFQAFNSYYGREITLFSPNGQEKLNGGSVSSVNWATTGEIDSVVLEYKIDSVWQKIVGPIPNTGQYDWTVPNTPSTSVSLRISAWGNITMDTSNNVFTIQEPSRISLKSGEFFTFSIEGMGSVNFSDMNQYHTIKIMDVNGSLLKTLSVNQQHMIWDRKDKQGKRVSSGVFIAELQGTTSRKVKFSLSD